MIKKLLLFSILVYFYSCASAQKVVESKPETESKITDNEIIYYEDTAHILEQLADNRIYRPRAEYVGPMDQTYVPIDQR